MRQIAVIWFEGVTAALAEHARKDFLGDAERGKVYGRMGQKSEIPDVARRG